MIEFTQVGDGTPKDVRVVTDDAEGELAMMDTALRDAEMEESETFKNLDAAVLDGTTEFVIPAGEVGMVGDAFEQEEVMLLDQIERWNEQALAKLED